MSNTVEEIRTTVDAHFKQGVEWMIGLEVKADHPVTPLNPAPTFLIYDAQIDERGKLFVRGKPLQKDENSKKNIRILRANGDYLRKRLTCKSKV